MEEHNMRIIALTKRILRQIVRDKRTMGLLIVAPIFVLTMLHFVFGNEEYTPKVGFVDVPNMIVEHMDVEGAKIATYADEKTAKEDLAARTIDGYLVFEGNKPTVVLVCIYPIISGATMKLINNAMP
jgi:ABC-2 type transport system permease protein